MIMEVPWRAHVDTDAATGPCMSLCMWEQRYEEGLLVLIIRCMHWVRLKLEIRHYLPRQMPMGSPGNQTQVGSPLSISWRPSFYAAVSRRWVIPSDVYSHKCLYRPAPCCLQPSARHAVGQRGQSRHCARWQLKAGTHAHPLAHARTRARWQRFVPQQQQRQRRAKPSCRFLSPRQQAPLLCRVAASPAQGLRG